jgi:hypothetical protein
MRNCRITAGRAVQQARRMHFMRNCRIAMRKPRIRQKRMEVGATREACFPALVLDL